jgi:GTPase
MSVNVNRPNRQAVAPAKPKRTRKPKHVSGFVTVLGRPNAGKSTLVNALVGQKVAIVSSKPQTTRSSIQAVLTLPEAQIVFLDTPGVHTAGKLIHRRMMESVKESLAERDLLIWMVDASLPLDPVDLATLELLASQRAPKFLVLNKIDRLASKYSLLPIIEAYQKAAVFEETVPVSARTGEGLDLLRAEIIKRLPAGPQYFPPDFITDQPERHLAAEIVREHVLHLTRQEVPHAVAVGVEKWEDLPGLLRISVNIYVERDGQKGILVGAGGTQLKQIGTAAREEIEKLFGKKVFLELFVKVKPGWRDDPAFLNELDWRYSMGVVPKPEQEG